MNNQANKAIRCTVNCSVHIIVGSSDYCALNTITVGNPRKHIQPKCSVWICQSFHRKLIPHKDCLTKKNFS